MNNGKICVSVCAETVDEFIKKTKRAKEIADVVELRFDCLAMEEFPRDDFKKTEPIHNKILTEVFNSEVIQTFRPKQFGGQREISEDELDNFWYSGYDGTWADVEEERVEGVMHWIYHPIICSHHDFERTPNNLTEIYQRLKNTGAHIVKIAIQANKITDTIGIWSLIKFYDSEKDQLLDDKIAKNTKLEKQTGIKLETEIVKLIPIAMGEAGKWTRILGLAYGAPLTYASLEEGNETAPGQISAKDLIEVYRVKELDKQTEIYGIIGNPVSHSLSPYMHNAAFKHCELNAVYIPFEVSNLDEFVKRMVRPETREIDWNLKGFSVTIPHKEAIIKHLDFVDEAAKEIGAVNTVKIVDGKLLGFNTDSTGFIEPLLEKYPDLKEAKVGIIGNGGAARACIYALKKEGAKPKIFARDTEKAKDLSKEFEVECLEFKQGKTDFSDIDILINTTPLGMKGELKNQSPASAEQLKNLHLAYDLVYNPIKTRFLREAENVGIPTIGGIEMLIAQGVKQFEIWTELKPPIKFMSQAAIQRLK